MQDPHLMLATLQHTELLAHARRQRTVRAATQHRRAARRAARLVAGADRLGERAERLRARAAVLETAPSGAVAGTA